MSLRAGTTVTMQVDREVSPYGFFLTDGRQEVLLPYPEAQGEIRQGQMVEVFLFHDARDRLTATMKQPLIRLGETALLEVVDVHPRFGAFLDIGIGRHVLLPYREQPDMKELRPQIGDWVYAVLGSDKQGRMLARLAGEADLAPLTFPAPPSWKNRWFAARVYNALQSGTFVVVEGGDRGLGVIGLIHETERTRLLRIGEKVEVRVTHVREDGRVNLSMRPPKEVSRDVDADRLLAFLQARPNGAMPYSDATPADIIQARFNMSKAAFKRALGKLMKEGAVYQKENWTYLHDAFRKPSDSPDDGAEG